MAVAQYQKIDVLAVVDDTHEHAVGIRFQC